MEPESVAIIGDKHRQIAPKTTAQRQEPPSDLDLVWKFALVVFAVMVFIVSCCIILLRIHRMCQNCKQKKLLQQKSVSAKKVKKRGMDGKFNVRRGDSIKKLRSGGWNNDGVNGHRIIAQKSPQPQPTPANSSLYGTRANSIKSFRSSHKGSGDSIDDESMTMTHEDDYDETEHRDVVPPNVSSNGDLKRQQSHKMYIKRQYSSNNNIHGEHGPIPISGAQSVGSSHYSSQYGGMSSMNNSYNNPYGMQPPHGHRGMNMNIVNNMAHFVAPRSLPAHNKLASNSVPPRHLIMGNGAHIDLEYGTDSNQDRFIVNDMMHDHDIDPDEDSLSMSDETHNFGVHSPNTFVTNKAPKGHGSHKRGGRQLKDSMNSSVDSSINISQMQHVRVRGQNSSSKRKKLTKESTETSVDDSEVALEDNVNELKQEILELKETVKGSKNKSKKKKQRERGQSAVRQSDVKGQESGAPGQTQEDSNNSGGSGSRDSEDTDEEVTVSDDPISEIMNNLKRMQSVKHHSI